MSEPPSLVGMPKIWSMGTATSRVPRSIRPQASLDGRTWRPRWRRTQPDAARGQDYGWPIISYSNEYFGGAIGEAQRNPAWSSPNLLLGPVRSRRPGWQSTTGDLFPEWKGNIFVGGLKGAQLARLVLKDGDVVGEETLLQDLDQRIRDVRQGPDGAIWLLTDDVA